MLTSRELGSAKAKAIQLVRDKLRGYKFVTFNSRSRSRTSLEKEFAYGVGYEMVMMGLPVGDVAHHVHVSVKSLKEYVDDMNRKAATVELFAEGV